MFLVVTKNAFRKLMKLFN